MTSNFVFSIANEADDGELRSVIRKIPMKGSISLTFLREPHFFTAASLGSVKSETIICRKAGKIIGFGERSLRKVYLGGEEKMMWYLHTLRLLPKEQNTIALIRGYQYFRSLPNESDIPYFLTTILDSNLAARNILESGRATMPRYTRMGTFRTYFIPLRKKQVKEQIPEIKRGNMTKDAYLCLDHYCRKNNFLAPRYDIDDLRGNGILPLLNPQDIYTCSFNGKVAGTLGVWNQQSFKQTVVDSYSPQMNVGRYIYNAGAYLSGAPYLPKTGNVIPMVYACLSSSYNDDSGIFTELLEQAITDWSGIGHDWLVVGLSAGHPFEKVALEKSTRKISSGIYMVHWNEDGVLFPPIYGNIHLEVATL